MGRLDGKVAIITGAGRGQGAAEAQLFVAEGASVVLADVLTDEVQVLADQLGPRAVGVELDVTSESGWDRAVAAALELGPLSVLVNNAGIHWTRPIEHESADELRRILDVNLVGAFLGIQAVIAPMRTGGGGSIVNVSSTAGLTGLPYHGAYGASKWALRGVTKTAAVELGPDGVRVNSVHPGPIATDMLPAAREADGAARFARLPLGRAGEASEVAQLVAFLASDESSYLTGAEIAVDGGSIAGPAPTYTWTPPTP